MLHRIKNEYMKKDIDDLIAFISGDVLVTLMAWMHMSEIDAVSLLSITLDFTDMLYKIITTVIIGFIGGFVGLAGKDCYLFYKEKYQKASRKMIFIYTISILVLITVVITSIIFKFS